MSQFIAACLFEPTNGWPFEKDLKPSRLWVQKAGGWRLFPIKYGGKACQYLLIRRLWATVFFLVAKDDWGWLGVIGGRDEWSIYIYIYYPIQRYWEGSYNDFSNKEHQTATCLSTNAHATSVGNTDAFILRLYPSHGWEIRSLAPFSRIVHREYRSCPNKPSQKSSKIIMSMGQTIPKW